MTSTWYERPLMEYEGTVAPDRARLQAMFPLLRAIPDDPDYRKYVPIEYRLDAKAIVGELAQDLSKGKSAHVWVELAHWGTVGAEIFAEASALVAGLALAGPILGVVGGFLMLGAGLQEAAEKIADNWSATGFSRGVVMGADKRRAGQLKETFGNLYFPPNYSFPQGRNVAIANYRAGLLAGYLQGRLLSTNQRVIFWRDLGRRMGDQSYRGPQEQWRAVDWSNWYTDAAGVFNRDHLVHRG
jgi:hypothetical protein